ncbi:3-hydroxyacyl-CoA dehydrogenase/enoyl-CoA hydratase family protein [Myxococcota bacterium]
MMRVSTVGIAGAGTMGSGIAQKVAAEGVGVTLVDKSRQLADGGKTMVEKLLVQGLERGVYQGPDVDTILDRIRPASDLSALRDVDLVIEAIPEQRQAKQELFEQLSGICRADSILATTTSFFLIRDLAAAARCPERVVGMHFFYHPAKNRLVEVVGHGGIDPDVLKSAWTFQHQIGKTPVASADSPGFLVSRFFAPWLNEAVRLHEEGHTIPSIEAAAARAFGIAMGPFELMNATGIHIASQGLAALGASLGAYYAPAASLESHGSKRLEWDLSGRPDTGNERAIADRLWGAVFHAVSELLSEGVGTADDIDVGARMGLRWQVGPVEAMNAVGLSRAAELAGRIEETYGLSRPEALGARLATGNGFALAPVGVTIEGDIATLMLNRPAKLNTLDPRTLEQLDARFEEVEKNDKVRAIVISGVGKAFMAGIDARFLLTKLGSGELDEVMAFVARGQELFRRIEISPKRVICRLEGVALGPGAALCLACHVVVATPRASLAFPETGLGIYPGFGATQRLTVRLGRGLARYLLFTGLTFDAKTLEALNLAWRVVPPEELDGTIKTALDAAPIQEQSKLENASFELKDAARFLGAVPAEGLLDGSLTLPGGTEILKVAMAVREKAPQAIRAAAALTDLAEKGDLDAGLVAETEGLRTMFATSDALEGLTALLEGRDPEFRDK